ncbi:MAG: hypothetical protein D6776_12080, partial [Planctomycetota bacterium]
MCPLEGTPYRERLLAQIDRCRRIHRYKLAAGSSDPPPPALCVVAGGTNVGKTSLANAVASRPLGSPSALARATRHVTILCHRDRAAAFLDPRFLPGYERVLAERSAPPGEPASEGGVVVLTHDDERFAALALADTPDIDSVLQANHRVAEDLRIAADAVLFVTSEEKYNDEVCVRTLEQAARWGKRVLLVLNKHSEPEPLEDLERRVLPRLASEAPADAPPPALFTVPALPNAAARPDALAQAAAAVRTALERLAQEADRLRAAAQAGARRALALELEELLSALEQEQAAVASYRSELRAIATRAADRWRERSASRPVQQRRRVHEQLVRALHVPVLDDVYRRGAAVFAAIGGFVRERLFGEPSAESRQRELEAEREREEREISETELRRALAEA